MGELVACRVCLATDIKLFEMYRNRLVSAYENLTGTRMMSSDGFPQHMCSCCSVLLLKCVSFKDKCHNSQELLNYLLGREQLTTEHLRNMDHTNVPSLTITTQQTIDYPEPTIKEEDTDNEQDADDIKETDDIKSETFSDEEPLSKKIKKKKSKKFKKEIDISEFDMTLPDIENVDSDIDVIVLNKQQQIDEVHSRKDSQNYLNSCYKCEFCFKGFMTETTYRNHMVRHDPKSGSHRCEICETRWPNHRTLRAHLATSHERKYICKLCNHVSKSSYRAKEHSQWHNGYTFICKICGATFARNTCRSDDQASRGSDGGGGGMRILFQMADDRSSRGRDYRSSHGSVGMMHALTVVGGCRPALGRMNGIGGGSTQSSKSTSHLTHVRLHHPSKHCCEMCGESFIGKNGLNMHKKKAHRDVKEARADQCLCTICGVQFNNMQAYQRHLSVAVNDICDTNLRPCVQCGDMFISDDLLKEHLKSHSKEEPTKCDECNRTFATERSYAIHYQRAHLGLRTSKNGGRRRETQGTRVVCEICGKECLSKANLVYHQRTHTGEKPYQCTECPKRFSVYQRLQIHRRTHTGERPYKCSHCPKAFKHKAALNRHDRVHTGAKPYTCGHCGKSFSQSNSMKLHVRTVHLKMPAPYRNPRGKQGEALLFNASL